VIDFAAIEARAAAATEGPWLVPSDNPRLVMQLDERHPNGWDGQIIATLPADEFGLVEEDTSQFIAHAREDIPVLLGERLRAVTRMRELEQEARYELARLTRDVDFAPTPDLIALEARAAAFNAAVDVVLGVVA
jgi:hypothetical protein